MKVDAIKLKDITEILEELSEAGVRYCIKRNFQFFDTKEIGSDIDLSLDIKDKEKVYKIFRKHGYLRRKTNGVDEYYFKRYDYDSKWLFFHFISGVNPQKVSINTKVTKTSKFYNNIPIPNAGHYFALLVMREIRSPGSLKERHLNEFNYLQSNTNKSDLLKDFREMMNISGVDEKSINKMEKVFNDTEKDFWNVLRKMKITKSKNEYEFKLGAFTKKLIKYPFKKVGSAFLGEKARSLVRILGLLFTKDKQQPLLSVSLVGVDGAGKTTLIESLKDNIPSKLPIETLSMKSQDPYTVIGKSSKKLMRYGKKRGGNFLLYFAIIFDWFDKYYRFKIISYKASKKKKILIFDRWSSDTVIHMEMKNKYTPRLIKFAWYLDSKLPKPDCYLFLDLKPDKAILRKKENTLYELEFRYDRYCEVYKNSPLTISVDASLPQENLTESAIKHILSCIKKKYIFK